MLILYLILGMYALIIIAFVGYAIPLVVVDRKWLRAYRLVQSYNQWVVNTGKNRELLIRPLEVLPPAYKVRVRDTLFRPYLMIITDEDVRNSLRNYRKTKYYRKEGRNQ
jgi:hypothetical protein